LDIIKNDVGKIIEKVTEWADYRFGSPVVLNLLSTGTVHGE
jgi:hypothetical protein